jgi:methyl-accepting chemotaxis protein
MKLFGAAKAIENDDEFAAASASNTSPGDLNARVADLEARLADANDRAVKAEARASRQGAGGDDSAELIKLRQMLDNMPVNVMMCDPQDFTVTYANQTSLDTLKTIEHLLPIKADELIGTCIDVFHKDPSHQRQLLADPKNLPHTAQIKIGDEILDLLVSAIYDDAGNYIAPMLTWSVVTEKAKADADAARLHEMVDNMPINVMMADPVDLTVVYANKTSIDTLRSIEHLLPIKADELVGTCIDIFHKNPSHQRQLLADPNNLPHKAQIALGEHTLALNVAAIMGKDGSYLGPMVSWEVVTEQVALASNMKNAVEVVASAAEEMQASAQSMSSTAEETNTRSMAVAAASEEAAQNVQTVAAAAEELSSSINEISRQVSQSNTISQEAVEQAQKTNVTVQGLAEAAQKIGDVVNLINDIASQTNLLALNATIEAARAGEAGKGFAVVASEVKNLATQTAKATEEIAAQITSMQSVTTEAVTAIDSITNTIGKISEIAAAISTAVEEQGAATSEISQNVAQAAAGTSEVSENIAGVTQAAQESGQSAGQVLDAAKSLAEEGERMRQEVEAFLGKLSS